MHILTSSDLGIDVTEMEQTDDWNFENDDSSNQVQPVIHLSRDESEQFNRLAKKIQELSAKTVKQLGLSQVGEFEIELSSENTIFQNPYRRSIKENDSINDEIKTMLEAGIIEYSKSSFSSPLIAVKKKDGTLRLCIDFRRFNKVTIFRKWPMKRIQDIFDKMSGAKIFSLIDCKRGYWQFGIKEKCRHYTAFSTTSGHYQFIRVPFGLKNAPAIFCEMMF